MECLLPLVGLYALAVTEGWEERVASSSDPRDLRLLDDWYEVLTSIGLLNPPQSPPWTPYEPRTDSDVVRRTMAMRHAYPGVRRPQSAPELSLAAIVAAAPCPRRPGWARGLRRLDDKLLWAMTDSGYFMANPRVAELAPAVVGALVLTCRAVPTAGLEDLDRDGHSPLRVRIAVALEWLADQLPTVELPDSAERALGAYARARLGDGPTR